jgi:hypothetical protein
MMERVPGQRVKIWSEAGANGNIEYMAADIGSIMRNEIAGRVNARKRQTAGFTLIFLQFRSIFYIGLIMFSLNIYYRPGASC